MENFEDTFKAVKAASTEVALLSDEKRNEILRGLADLTDNSHPYLLEANAKDLDRMEKSNPLYDRLQLTDNRLDGIAAALREVADLPSPLGEVMEERTLPNGIELKKIRVPFGVIGIVYEARPNVTFDVFALCLKSGNASILKGGADAHYTNEAVMTLIHKVLEEHKISPQSCVLMPSTHEATAALLNAVGYVDVCIPRGGRNLINFVRDTAKVPVIETGAGVVHTYFDKEGDLELGKKIIENGKTRRVSVCNALDTLLINSERLNQLPQLVAPLAQKKVDLYCDIQSYSVLKNHYPENLLHQASDEDCDREWMDLKMGVWVVNNVYDAAFHIQKHGSGHSESIITDNEKTAEEFCKMVDAACVYVNLPTTFTDGGEFGLGAEIGISTQKLGPRGPMGLREMTTYKYILKGNGQTRP